MTEYRKLLITFESESFSLALEGFVRFESYRKYALWADFFKHKSNGNVISVVCDFLKKSVILRKNGKIIKESYG